MFPRISCSPWAIKMQFRRQPAISFAINSPRFFSLISNRVDALFDPMFPPFNYRHSAPSTFSQATKDYSKYSKSINQIVSNDIGSQQLLGCAVCVHFRSLFHNFVVDSPLDGATNKINGVILSSVGWNALKSLRDVDRRWTTKNIDVRVR